MNLAPTGSYGVRYLLPAINHRESSQRLSRPQSRRHCSCQLHAPLAHAFPHFIYGIPQFRNLFLCQHPFPCHVHRLVHTSSLPLHSAASSSMTPLERSTFALRASVAPTTRMQRTALYLSFAMVQTELTIRPLFKRPVLG